MPLLYMRFVLGLDILYLYVLICAGISAKSNCTSCLGTSLSRTGYRKWIIDYFSIRIMKKGCYVLFAFFKARYLLRFAIFLMLI